MEERLCSLCFRSWEKSAAFVVWKASNGRIHERAYAEALAQFIAGRSCACEIGRQPVKELPW